MPCRLLASLCISHSMTLDSLPSPPPVSSGLYSFTPPPISSGLRSSFTSQRLSPMWINCLSTFTMFWGRQFVFAPQCTVLSICMPGNFSQFFAKQCTPVSGNTVLSQWNRLVVPALIIVKNGRHFPPLWPRLVVDTRLPPGWTSVSRCQRGRGREWECYGLNSLSLAS